MLVSETLLDDKNNVVLVLTDEKKKMVYIIPPDKARELAGAIHRTAVLGITNILGRKGAVRGRLG